MVKNNETEETEKIVCSIGKDGDYMNYYRIDYYSRRIGAYTYKIIKADTPEQAVKRARIKNIEEVTLVSMEV